MSVERRIAPSSRSTIRMISGIGAVAYLAVTSAYLLLHGSWPTPDFLIPPLLLFAVIVGRGWSFVIDWSSFLLLLIAYQSFAGLADDLNSRVQYTWMIDADKWLVRNDIVVPVALQDRFFRDGRIAWYDWAATFLHAAHFVVPSILGFILWMKNRRTYWRYLLTTITMFYAAFITYIVYPAAPPWLAAQYDLVPPVTRVLIHTLSSLPSAEPLALLYQNFSPNDVAAVPSLHSAAPMMVALVAMALWGWRGIPVLVYPLAGGLAWMYLGEHYLIDVLFGWLYALGAFVVVWVLLSRLVLALRRTPAVQRLEPANTKRFSVPSWPLAAVAVALALYVWVDPIVKLPLHPAQGAVIPDLGIRAGEIEATRLADLDPRECSLGSSSTVYVDRLLGPVAGQYGAYLQGIDEEACFSLSAMVGIPALWQSEIDGIDFTRMSESPSRLRIPAEPPEYFTMAQAGELVESGDLPEGLVPGHRYALVVRVDNIEHRDQIRDVVAHLSQFAFGPNSTSP